VNTFLRLGKFNLVGAMGMVVQLAALAFFNRLMSGRYLYASGIGTTHGATAVTEPQRSVD
jgi:putative flippase GtrA